MYFVSLISVFLVVSIFEQPYSRSNPTPQSVDPISGLPLIPSGGPMPGYLGPPPPGLLNGPPNLPNINAINSMNSGIPLGGTSSINPIGVGGYPNVGRNGFPGPQGSIPYGSGQVAPVRGSLNVYPNREERERYGRFFEGENSALRQSPGLLGSIACLFAILLVLIL